MVGRISTGDVDIDQAKPEELFCQIIELRHFFRCHTRQLQGSSVVHSQGKSNFLHDSLLNGAGLGAVFLPCEATLQHAAYGNTVQGGRRM